MDTTRDELEFAISQYLDGNLVGAEEVALEERLAGDADARAVLAEYRSLDRVLRSAGVPEVDFEAMADRIRTAVYREPEPVQVYRLSWVRTVSALALAACVVVAAAVGIRRMTTEDGRGVGPIAGVPERPDVVPTQIVVIDSMARPAVSTQPVAIASVGPSAATQDNSALARYHEDLLSRPSQVIIARSGYAAQDGASQDGALLP
jgi:negative regulator of sigma E activity